MTTPQKPQRGLRSAEQRSIITLSSPPGGPGESLEASPEAAAAGGGAAALRRPRRRMAGATAARRKERPKSGDAEWPRLRDSGRGSGGGCGAGQVVGKQQHVGMTSKCIFLAHFLKSFLPPVRGDARARRAKRAMASAVDHGGGRGRRTGGAAETLRFTLLRIDPRERRMGR